MKIGIAMPLYLRGKKESKSVAKVIEGYSKLGIMLHICGSERELSYNFAKPYLNENIKYFEVPQSEFCNKSYGTDALREKFNDSLKTLPFGFDWYCLVGADDLASPDFFKALEKVNPSEAIMAGVSMNNPLYLLDEENNWESHSIKLKYADKYKLLAGINCFSKVYMNRISFRPYVLNGCETGAETYCEQNGGTVVGLDGTITMFKGEGVLNPLEKCLKAHL